MPNYYAIKAKEVSPEILSTSTKPYYIPFHNTTNTISSRVYFPSLVFSGVGSP